MAEVQGLKLLAKVPCEAVNGMIAYFCALQEPSGVTGIVFY